MPQNFSKITINFKTAHPSFIHSKKTLQKVGGTLLNLCKMLGTFERLHICDQSNLEILNIFWTHKSKNKLISEFSKLYFFLLFYFSIGKRQDSTILGACDISIDSFFPPRNICGMASRTSARIRRTRGYIMHLYLSSRKLQIMNEWCLFLIVSGPSKNRVGERGVERTKQSKSPC